MASDDKRPDSCPDADADTRSQAVEITAPNAGPPRALAPGMTKLIRRHRTAARLDALFVLLVGFFALVLVQLVV